MEANIKIIDKMLEEQGTTASKEAKEALINFSVLFGEKMIRKCVEGKPKQKVIATEEIRQAYELAKGMRSIEYEHLLE